MIHKLYKKFSDLSIRYKLLISYLLLIAVPLCLFLVINTFVTSRETERQALYSARRVLSQTKSYLEFKTESIRNTLNFIALNDITREILERKPQDYSNDIGLWYIDSLKFNRVLLTAKSNSDIANIHLYMKQGLASIFQNEDLLDLREAVNSGWYRRLISGKDVMKWFPKKYFLPHEGINYIYGARTIPGSQNILESIGVVKADIPEKVFQTILNQAVFTQAASAVLINSNQEIICASSANSYNRRSLNSILAGLATGDFQNAVWKTMMYRREKILIGAQNIEKSDWKLLLIVPYKEILDLSVKSRRQLVIIFLIIALLTFPLAFIVTESSTKRFKKLISQMRKIETGDFHLAEIPPENNDEIGELTKNFNQMLMKINTLMNEKYILGTEVKNMELKALQAQINPHFLYNTLDLINWMSIRANVPEIRRLVEVLSKFYRLSLSKGEDIVTIKNELEHVQAYVEIQNMRFGNSIHCEMKVPETLFEYMIPKLVLQPIIENSILHGILEKDDESGVIKISGEMKGDVINLCIEDDGVGMTEEKASHILTQSASNEHHGYGAKNINERLKIYYGNEYGLSYHSEPGKGTVVTVKIPAMKDVTSSQ